MSTQPPFRMPCEGVAGAPLFYFGHPFQHGLAPVLVPKFANTTTVPNPAGGPDIAPFEQFQDLSGATGCEVNRCTGGPAPCTSWKPPFAANVFTDTGDFVDMAVAHKRGFKNVMARRYWNGRFGYLDASSGGIDTVQPCSDPSTMVSWLSAQSSFSRTRYCTLDAACTYSHLEFFADPADNIDITQTASLTEEIDIVTGILSPTALTVTPNTASSFALANLFWAFKKYGEITSYFVAVTSSFVDVVWASNGFTATVSGGGGLTKEVVSFDFAGGTFSRDVYGNDPLGGAWAILFHEEATLSGTGLAYSSHDIRVNPDFVHSVHGHIDIAVTGTLSGSNRDSKVYSDLIDLLNEWDLADDKQYPWRTDIKVSLAPLMSRDELLNQEFLATGYFVKDYSAAIVDSNGFTNGDSGWDGGTGVTVSPGSDTGTYRTSMEIGPFASGSAIDIQLPPFSHTEAAITCTIIGGAFPSGVSMSGAGHITGTVGDDGRWGVTIEVTCGVAAATGDILGAPNPAGYQDYFDSRYLDYKGCCYHPGGDLSLSAWSWYLQGWGKWLSDFNSDNGCQIPLNATQWNNPFESVSKPIGAWLFYNDKRINYCGSACPSDVCGSGDSSALVGCKYAEIVEQWPSQNFAMPAGDAKFWYDENHVCCATHISGSGAGSTWSLVDTTTGATPADGLIDLTKPWGGPVVGGFYNLTSYSAGVVTLGSKAWDVPSNWVSKSHVTVSGTDDEDSCFGILRWSDKPALLGRVAVTTTGPGTTFTFTVAQPAFGMDTSTHQEQIDLYDASMTAVATNITATRISDTQFSIAAGHTTAVWVQIHGSAKSYVNDTSPKGDVTVLEWLADLRSIGEWGRLNTRLDCSGTQIPQPTTNVGGGPVTQPFAEFSQVQCCLPFQPCGPKVICISPNGETFANGLTYDFPEDFACDDLYGSKWWKKPEQSMTDLFWQRPHRPCNIEPCAKWTMDDGLCPASDSPGSCPPTEESPAPEYFFAVAPQVEARLTVPSSSDSCSHAYGTGQDEAGPALPSGIQIGWLSPVDYDSGEVALPPEPPGVTDPGTPNGAATPWLLRETICDHSAGCRFGYSLPGC